jgi:hypothetical protein
MILTNLAAKFTYKKNRNVSIISVAPLEEYRVLPNLWKKFQLIKQNFFQQL